MLFRTYLKLLQIFLLAYLLMCLLSFKFVNPSQIGNVALNNSRLTNPYFNTSNAVSAEPDRHYLGLFETCFYCHAQRWPREDPTTRACCHDGLIQLEKIIGSPQPLLDLITCKHPKWRDFMTRIRMYNIAFQNGLFRSSHRFFHFFNQRA